MGTNLFDRLDRFTDSFVGPRNSRDPDTFRKAKRLAIFSPVF